MVHDQACPTRLRLVTLAATAALLSACGGGADPGGGTAPPAPPVTVSGVVADGPLQGATACYDLNDNAVCDAGEPTATTNVDGEYRFDVDPAVAGRHAVIAMVPATAVDRDTGQAVGAAYTLKSPPSGTAAAQQVFVSPLTTLVVDIAAARGIPVAEAVQSVQGQLGLSASPLDNFVASRDERAARLAATLNAVIVQVTQMASTAGVPADQTKALVESVTLADLATLAARVDAGGVATPAQLAAAAVADRHITAASVAEHAQIAQAVAVAAPEAETGPFVAVRRFTWTDANNYRLQVFVGDSTPKPDGTFDASEVRVHMVNGADSAFNRNTAYWHKAQQRWEVCPLALNVVNTMPEQAATATTPARPQRSVYCGGSESINRVASYDVAGQRMADVVAKIRASTHADMPGFNTDANGLPTLWGPNPAALGDAVFPAGARFQYREQTSDAGHSDRFSLTDKPRVAPQFRQAATLEQLRTMGGNWVDPGATIDGNNTLYLDEVTVAQPNASLLNLKRYRAALHPTNDQVRYFACDVLASGNLSINCEHIGEGTATVASQADSRVLRFTGYPVALTSALKRQRQFVQYSGVVFGGYRDFERSALQHRPNTIAWNAMSEVLGLPQVVAPTAPPTSGPVHIVREFTFVDANNYRIRTFTGDSSQVDAQGNFLLNDNRTYVGGGLLQPFVRTRLFWNGTQWYDCPSDGIGVLRVNNVAPFRGVFCGTYEDERASSVVVTLAGRNMASVVRDIRAYPSPDGTFEHENWGPDPDVHTVLSSRSFPADATMEFRGTRRVSTPLGIVSNSPVRVPPADPTVPFSAWASATTVEELVASFSGDLGGGPVHDRTTVWAGRKYLPVPAAPQYTDEVEIRIAFDANGSRARFYRAYRLAATGALDAFEAILDTTYRIDVVGDARVLRFAGLPEGFERDIGYERIYAQRSGTVWYAFKDAIPSEPMYSVRLNETAMQALKSALGIQ